MSLTNVPFITTPAVLSLNGHAAEFFTSLATAAAMLPGYSQDAIRTLLDVNRGKEGSNMTTLGLAQAVSNQKVYRIMNGKLEDVISKSSLDVIDLEERASHPHEVKIPPYLEVEALWDDQPLSSGNGNNILGDNGRLILDRDVIEVPTVQASNEMLAYYGATLIEEGDIVHFPDEVFPLFRMQVGEKYVSDTLMTDAGGGFYLEYHDDAPHFHLPLHGAGHYLLARWNEDKTKLQVTGFQIPDGKAVYSKKGAIHCDAALIGELIVGYTIAKDCSTVILQNKNGKRTDIKFY
jgi:hypothetical protein